MTAQELYLEATRRGLRLEPVGDKLAVIPARRCPPEFADVLRRHKGVLLALLESRSANLTPDCAPGCTLPGQAVESAKAAMTIPELIARVEAAGAELALVDGRLAVKPPGRCPPELLAEIREQRERITQTLQQILDRRGCAPESVRGPIQAEPPEFILEDAALVFDYLARQGKAVATWIEQRSGLYRFPASWGDVRLAASFDLLAWQFAGLLQSKKRKEQVREIVQRLRKDASSHASHEQYNKQTAF